MSHQATPSPPLDLHLFFYPVTVDYGLTLEQMIEAGHYDWADPNVNAEHFPVDGIGAFPYAALLVHFDRPISADAVLAELDRLDLRPGTIPELLALGARHPDLQRQFPIAAPASVWTHRDGGRCVAYLWGSAGERDLNLDDVARGWYDYYRFLAFRKS